MPLPLHTSSILYDQVFNTLYDFTVSFTYKLDSGGFVPSQAYGFSVFFIDGKVPTLQGGDWGPGLGVVGSSGTSLSAVSGVFATLGFDFRGEFCQKNTLPVFTTGNNNAVTNSLGLRITTDFIFISSFKVSQIDPFIYSYRPVNVSTHTVRVGVRKNFKQIDVYSLNGTEYVKLITFNTSLSTIPPTAKCGISFSGDLLFNVSNITFNYT